MITKTCILLSLVASTFAGVKWLGFGDGTAEYNKFDSEIRGIVVDVSEPFDKAGTVKKFRFFAGGVDGPARCHEFNNDDCWVDRILWFHILERFGDGPCGIFNSTRMKKHVVVDGPNEVVLDDPQPVEAGMFYGFSWSEYGAVSFDFNQSTDINYCWGDNKEEGSGLLKWGQTEVELSEATADEEGVSYRKYAFEVEFESDDCEWLGCGDGSGAELYDKFDTETRGLFVDISDPFPIAGEVTGFRFVTGGKSGDVRCGAYGPKCWVGRDLLLGIFKRNGDGPCGEFEAVKVKKVKGVLDGYNYVELQEAQVVEAGWFYGFSWGNYGGSISFDFADLVEDNLCYCYGDNKNEGSGFLEYDPATHIVNLNAVPEDINAPNAWDEKYRVSYRKYAFNVEFCPAPVDCWLGCGDSEMEYDKFDTEKRGIIVDVSEPFPTAGVMDTFRFFAGGKDGARRCASPEKFDSDTCWVGRDILLGIFRRVGDGPCGDFEVIRTKKWTVQDGVNVVVLDTPQAVEAGDFYGFSWRMYGAVSFDFNDGSDELCYCHGDGDEKGSGKLVYGTPSVTLSATDIADDYSVSYRKYAFEVYYCDTIPPCEWIGWGDSQTLYENFDTEKKGIVVDIQEGVPGYGVLKRFRFTTGASKPDRCNKEFNDPTCWIGRKLKIGVFKRLGSGPCGQFEVGKQKVVVVEDGTNVIDLTNPWEVYAGEFIGFSWILFGSVSYNDSDTVAYCWGTNKGEQSGVVGDGYTPGNVVTLEVAGGDYRPSYREYAFEAEWCPEEDPCVNVGCGSVQLFPKFDTEQRGVIVDRLSVLKAGFLKYFYFYAGGTDEERCSGYGPACWVGRTLWFGIFDRVSGGDGECGQFQLVDYKKWTVEAGYNKVELLSPKAVNDGQYIGFYWFFHGAVSWQDREIKEENFCYCYNENKALKGGELTDVGNVVNLMQQPGAGETPESDPWGFKYPISYREYAFGAHWCPTV